MPVEICKRPSAEALDRFPKALKFLKLKAFAHSSQKQGPVLRLGSLDEITEFCQLSHRLWRAVVLQHRSEQAKIDP